MLVESFSEYLFIVIFEERTWKMVYNVTNFYALINNHQSPCIMPVIYNNLHVGVDRIYIAFLNIQN